MSLVGVKSDLQKSLESEGWRLLTVENINIELILQGDVDEQLKKKYLDKGYKSVKITSDYDLKGNIIHQSRAVYVKE